MGQTTYHTISRLISRLENPLDTFVFPQAGETYVLNGVTCRIISVTDWWACGRFHQRLALVPVPPNSP